MASSFLLVVALGGLAICHAQSGGGSGSGNKCQDEVVSNQQCRLNNAPPPPKTDFQAMHDAYEKCFNASGCVISGPPPGMAGAAGHGGPPQPHGPPPGFDDACFRSVGQKIEEEFVSCMTAKDPEFKKSSSAHMPPGGPMGGPMGGPPPGMLPPDGPPPGFGPPPGGHGGPPPPGPPPPAPPEALSQICGIDMKKAVQLNSCLTTAFQENQPSKEELRKHFDATCKLSETCALSQSCQKTLADKHQILCSCHQQAQDKLESFFKAEQSCAGKPKPSGPPNGGKVDCSKPPPDPCDEGFDKFFERVSKPATSPSGTH